MVATRSMQLTVKKSTRTQKTLEGQLVTSSNGERSSLSTRVAELDLLMPQKLGVSKAVLDSVIFCHQDESLWPMSEPLTLKKKFDEIFEALKYTKAIDNIKKLRKDQGLKLSKLRLQEQSAKEVKIRGDKVCFRSTLRKLSLKFSQAERQSRELDRDLKALREEIAELTSKAEDAEENAKHAWDQMSNYKVVLDTLSLNRQKQAFHQANIDKLKRNLEERSESDEWLRTEIENHEQRTRSREEHQQKLKKQYASIGDTITSCREKLSRKHAEIGRYEEQKASHEEQLEDRKSMVKETSRQHSIRGYETNLNDARMHEYMAKITRLFKTQEDLVEKARRETEREIKKVQEALDRLNEQRSTLVAEKKASKQQILINDQKIKTCRSELANMDTDEGDLAILDANIEQLEKDLEKARRESRAASWEKLIQDQDARLRSFSEKTTLLKNELIESTKHATELAQMEHLQKQLADRQRNLEKLKSVHHHKIQTLLHHDWQPETLDADFQKVAKRQADELRDAEHQRASVSRDLDQIDLELSSAEKRLASGSSEFSACEKRLRDAIEGEPEGYPNELAEIQRGRDLLQSDVNNFDNLRDYYQKAILLADSKSKCKLCTRGFKSKKEEEDFVRFMKRKLEKDDELIKSQNQLADQEEALRKAKSVGPDYETWARFKKVEMPQLEETKKELTSRRAATVQKLEDQDIVVNDLEQAKVELDSFTKPVANILRYYDDATSLTAQIQDLKEKQKDIALPHALKEIREQLDRAEDESRSVTRLKDKLSGDRESMRTKINDLELQLKDARTDLAKANYGLREKENKLRQVAELDKANETQRDRGRQTDNQLRDISPQIEAIQSQLEEVKAQGNQKEQTHRKEASKLGESVHRLEQADKRIQKYEEEGGAANLDRCQREIESLEQEVQQAENERTEVIKMINKITEDLRAQENIKRTIHDNLDYRASVNEMRTLETEIANLEGQNAEADRDHWQAEANRWQNLYNKHSTLKTSKLSEAKTKDDILVRLIKDWNTDYKEAAHNYKKAHIEVEV